MNEISVNVQQEVGKISWNFEEIKTTLEAELAVFVQTVYTDDTIKDAKGDLAILRKLRASVEEKRKEVKDKCLEPYAIIEKQAKELTGIIDKPISVINEKVKDYERRRKEAVLREINAYWSEKVSDFPEELMDRAYKATYDARWLNASMSKKSWKAAIDNAVQRIEMDVQSIRTFESEFENDMYKAYLDRLQLSDAVATMNRLEAQKKRILETEKRRKEEEERREQERLNRMAAEAVASALPSNMEPVGKDGIAIPSEKVVGQILQSETPHTPIGQAIESIERGAFARAAGKSLKTANEKYTSREILEMTGIPVRNAEGNVRSTTEILNELVREYGKACGKDGKVFLVRGTDSQYQKIRDYIKFIGAEFEEV